MPTFSGPNGQVPEHSAAHKNWIALWDRLQRAEDRLAALEEARLRLEGTVATQQNIIVQLQQAFAVSVPRGSGPTVGE